MKNFSDTLKRISGGKMFRYGNTLSPQRDWIIILVVAIVLLSMSCAWNEWTFMRIENGETLTVSPSQTAGGFDPGTLTAVQSLFAARAAQESLYQTGYHFVDPSH